MSVTKLGKGALNSAEVTPFKARQAHTSIKCRCQGTQGTHSEQTIHKSLLKPIADNESPHYS